MAKLVTENISKRFKNQDVLKHINITLEITKFMDYLVLMEPVKRHL